MSMNIFRKQELTKTVDERIEELTQRIIRLENKLRSHAQDEFGHTWEQKEYDNA